MFWASWLLVVYSTYYIGRCAYIVCVLCVHQAGVMFMWRGGGKGGGWFVVVDLPH